VRGQTPSGGTRTEEPQDPITRGSHQGCPSSYLQTRCRQNQLNTVDMLISKPVGERMRDLFISLMRDYSTKRKRTIELEAGLNAYMMGVLGAGLQGALFGTRWFSINKYGELCNDPGEGYSLYCCSETVFASAANILDKARGRDVLLSGQDMDFEKSWYLAYLRELSSYENDQAPRPLMQALHDMQGQIMRVVTKEADGSCSTKLLPESGNSKSALELTELIYGPLFVHFNGIMQALSCRLEDENR